MNSRISRDDLEQTLRSIQADVDDAAVTAKPAGMAIGGSLLIGAIGISYLIGHRKARRQTTIVEIHRS